MTRKAKKKTGQQAAIELREVESLRAELDRIRTAGGPPRWNADPDEVRRSVLKLVLTLVEFVRQLLERQAIRRMEGGSMTDEETEAVGLALMRLEETVRDLASQFGLAPEDLNLDLGPIGKLV
ncbi:MAG TPA: gas vesicle protein K [Vicinamibacterales bacterium]|nr:gas vesicle protein K [Vicinamibacterales bacterium]